MSHLSYKTPPPLGTFDPRHRTTTTDPEGWGDRRSGGPVRVVSDEKTTNRCVGWGTGLDRIYIIMILMVVTLLRRGVDL